MKPMPGYNAETLRLCEELEAGGQIFFLDIKHDDWCSFWSGKSETCDCNPDVRVYRLDAERPIR